VDSQHANDWPATEQILDRFRNWLDETRTEVELLTEDGGDQTETQAVGLYQLVEQLTALRHEVKLLTKSIRGGEERGEATLLSMQAAIEQFQSVCGDDLRAPNRSARPWVEAIVDLDEALQRGRRAMENARHLMRGQADKQLTEARERLEQLYRAQPWWRRALCRPWHEALQEIYSGSTTSSQRPLFDSLLEGYDLIQARLQRTLDEHAIIRMQCVGRQVDPHSMTVIETLSDPSRPPGLVVEEIRTGYYWKTKVLRFAEVKAVGES
jgi:molecular chaperone GrpE